MTSNSFKQLQKEKEFIQNWLSDRLAAIDTELNQPTRLRLLESCGRGCFLRFDFKQEIARQGKGNLENLIAAYR